MLRRTSTAIAFAKGLRDQFQGDLAEKTRLAVAAGDGEHKRLAPDIHAFLRRFSGEDADVLLDWEGMVPPRTGTQQRSYPLLGTWAHPDAAVLRPFTCAIEFDREPGGTEDRAHFKLCVMKAACHVQSRAYEAALLVFTLQRPSSTAETYMKDPEDPDLAHTRELLRSLRTSGLFFAFVPARKA